MGQNRIIQSAILYDANYIETLDILTAGGSPFTSPYDISTYEPLWTIKAESAILEDIEGNSVYYIFTFDNSNPSDTDFMSLEQTSTIYKKELDTDDPSTFSWEDTEWFFADDGLATWDFTLNTRDDASKNVVTDGDNYNTPTDATEIIIDACTFPIKPRWSDSDDDDNPSTGYISPQKIYLNGNYYNWVSIDPPAVRNNIDPDPSSFDPSTDSELEYKVEWNDGGTWTVLYDYGDAQPVPPVDATDSMVGESSYWILSDSGTFTEYRMRIRNYINEEGMYSDGFVTI